MVTTHEITNKRGLREFIRFPFRLYRTSENWIPPLLSDEWATFRKDKNPAFSYCDTRFWLAKRDGETVGRIVAICNNKANERWEQKRLRFGWIDFEDDPQVSAALIGAVEAWAAELGLAEVHGPMGFTDMDKEGMLVEGFDELGTLPMIYNYDYYPAHMERLGYTKDVDWLEYEIAVPEKLDERFERVKTVVFEKYNLRLLEAKRARDLKPYAHQIFDVLNASFVNLYGFVPLSPEQIDVYVEQYFTFIQPDFTKVVLDQNDEVVGFEVAMPRLSHAMQKSRGRLAPIGFIPLLRALAHPSEVVFYLVGVRPDYQSRGVNAILMSEFYQALIDRGVRSVATCGELEDNHEITLLMNSWPHRKYKRRRAWVKAV
jgi:ribosomal protein S18 acetylase RimI-like enzyme